MADVVFNRAKGRVAELAALGAANDALIAVPIETSGIESDATLIDYDNLSVLLAAANNEQSTMGRKTLASVTVTVDDTNNRVDVDTADPTWSPTSAQAITRIACCYDPDTTGGTDADIIPLFVDDMALTTATSGTLTYNVASGGFDRIS